MHANQFPVIVPLVARHAEDAAFYWSQLDGADQSPQIGFNRLAHFNRLLDAHLDGLRVAGPAGRQAAFAALERWKKPGEAFVCCWFAAGYEDEQPLADLLELVGKRPDELLRGVVSALAWLPLDKALPVLQRWSMAEAVPVAQVAALRAAALIGRAAAPAMAQALATLLRSDNAHVRAACCRAMAALDAAGAALPPLRAALLDADLAVRAEAAIALASLRETEAAAPVLWQCVAAQAALHARAGGWYRKAAARRLQRWVRHLAWLAPLRHPEIGTLLTTLPPRASLAFALCHGDMAHLPFVIGQMANPDVDRYAAWVWQTLTGIDLAGAGLALPEPDPATLDLHARLTDARLDADNGLPAPNVTAVHACVAAYPAPGGKRMLLGRELDPVHARALLDDAPQIIRALAAQALNQARTRPRIDIRAPAPRQRLAIAAWDGAANERNAA